MKNVVYSKIWEIIMTNNDRENFHEGTRQNEKERDFNMISHNTRKKAPRQEEKPKVQSVRVKPNKGPCLSNKILFVRKITDESDITSRQANNAAAKTSKDAAVQAEW